MRHKKSPGNTELGIGRADCPITFFHQLSIQLLRSPETIVNTAFQVI
jgi:hypothetical protein